MTLMTGVFGPIFQKLRYDEGKDKERCIPSPQGLYTHPSDQNNIW